VNVVGAEAVRKGLQASSASQCPKGKTAEYQS
jgi:hypothetical protein